MSKNRKPRKAHKPCRPSIPMTIRFNSSDERLLQIVPHQELSKLIAGDGDAVSWNTIVARCNVGLTLAAAYFNTDAQLIMAGSLNALCDTKERHGRVGRYGLSGDEARMIGIGLVTTDELQLLSTRRELRNAIDYVMENGAQ